MKTPLLLLLACLASFSAYAHPGAKQEHWITRIAKWSPPLGSTFLTTVALGVPFAATEYLLSPNGYPPEKVEAARREAQALLHEEGEWEDYPNFLDFAEALWWDAELRLFDSEEVQARWLAVELAISE